RQLIPWWEPPRRVWPRPCGRSGEREGGDTCAAIHFQRKHVEVDRCAREGVRDRATVSRSRSAPCRADRRERICRQTRPAECGTRGIEAEQGSPGCARRSRQDEPRETGIVEGEKHLGLLAFDAGRVAPVPRIPGETQSEHLRQP